ncbi:MAG: UDP-N-acetylmuramoyl-L-alanine--D-glutamate ligase [Proteobacteria bacterium]|nr:UDP-N-acetylmuramoyl-L-alanine--D-glutamate ligase [Pseudomonadota bacterium]
MAGAEPGGNGVRCRSLVIGLGATGLSLARFLSARGDAVLIADTREKPPGLEALQKEGLDVELALGAYPAGWLDRVDRIWVSPGVSLDHPVLLEAKTRGMPLSNDIGLLAQRARDTGVPLVAITGSNGKSTVTTMLATMLERAAVRVRTGGNLGPPALELLGGDTPELYLLELSSFQLDLVSGLQAKVATLLNVSADHLDRYADFAAYAASKARIFERCEKAIVNRDDATVMSLLPPGCEYLSFGLDAPAGNNFGLLGNGLNDADCFLARGNEELLAVAELPLSGRHNLANALAALAMADVLSVPMDTCVRALRVYTGLPHRTQLVAEQDGIRWVDDSKGTNVGAAVAAAEGLQGPLLLIAGGQAKAQDFAPLAAALAGKARSAILLGQDAQVLAEALLPICPVSHAGSMREAVEIAHAQARRGDTVLLSPACGSQDMFDDFRDRGRVFSAAVAKALS